MMGGSRRTTDPGYRCVIGVTVLYPSLLTVHAFVQVTAGCVPIRDRPRFANVCVELCGIVTHLTRRSQELSANVCCNRYCQGVVGEQQPGSGEVNMADVARRAGVSIATVSRALRDVPGVSQPTRDRIRQIAQELSYVVSPEASALSRGSTGRVAIVMPRLDAWFYSAMLASMAPVLRGAELDMLVYQVDGEEQRTRFLRELPARRKADAVILTALPMAQAEVERLDLMGVHVVVAGGEVRDYPHVQVDDLEAGRTAVQHLVDLGHRRIAMIRTSDTDGTTWSSDLQRLRAWRETLAAAGLDAADELLVTETYGVDAGARAMARLLALSEPPTAVFAYSDELAFAAIAHARAPGARGARATSRWSAPTATRSGSCSGSRPSTRTSPARGGWPPSSPSGCCAAPRGRRRGRRRPARRPGLDGPRRPRGVGPGQRCLRSTRDAAPDREPLDPHDR